MPLICAPARLVGYLIVASVLFQAGAFPQSTAATVLVDGLGDQVAEDGVCTLREAIQAVNSGSLVNECDATETHVIEISASPIVLTSALPQLGTMTIQGNGSEVSGNLVARVLDIAPDAQVTIDDLIVSNGNAGAGFGGGIRVTNAELTLNRCVVRNNRATAGGGIRSIGTSAVVSINDCLIENNQTPNEGGGGINNDAGSTMTITNSTIAHNSGRFAGGIANYNGAVMLIRNSTISGNRCNANLSGGGVENFDGGSILTIESSTITDNTCDGSTSGGGIFNNTTTPVLVNTLVAGNSNIDGRVDLSGNFSSDGHNLIGNSTGSIGFNNGVNNDLVGDAGDPIDALILALDDQGGPTQTHALLDGSPAIDAGSTTAAPGLDQRGIPRPQGSQVDIGAYEARFFLLAIQGSGDGAGRVTSTQLNCLVSSNQTAGDCIASHVELEEVTVNASAEAGSRFVGWSGSCSGTQPQSTIVMDAKQACIAIFTAIDDPLFADRFELPP